jgi:hypothetical protein
MYLFDPNGGRRRRALIRDKAVGLTNDAREAIDKKTRDLGNRAQGLMHEAKSMVTGSGGGEGGAGEREAENRAGFGTA